MEFIHHLPEKPSFSRPGATGYKFPIVGEAVEIDYIDSSSGHGGKVVSDEITHFYYILSGGGEFIINNQVHEVTEGELVEILPHHSFDYRGRMKMILMLNPPFEPSKVREVKD